MYANPDAEGVAGLEARLAKFILRHPASQLITPTALVVLADIADGAPYDLADVRRVLLLALHVVITADLTEVDA